MQFMNDLTLQARTLTTLHVLIHLTSPFNFARYLQNNWLKNAGVKLKPK